MFLHNELFSGSAADFGASRLGESFGYLRANGHVRFSVEGTWLQPR